jgi:hypothetical protein
MEQRLPREADSRSVSHYNYNKPPDSLLHSVNHWLIRKILPDDGLYRSKLTCRYTAGYLEPACVMKCHYCNDNTLILY